MPEYLADWKFTLVEAATVAGTDDTIASASLDMSGYDAVAFFTTFGVITVGAVTTFIVQQSSDDAVADAYVALTGATHTVAADDDGQTFVIEVIRPLERYVRAAVTRATANAVIGEIYALQYHSSHKPITSTVTDTMTTVSVASPAEV